MGKYAVFARKRVEEVFIRIIEYKMRKWIPLHERSSLLLRGFFCVFLLFRFCVYVSYVCIIIIVFVFNIIIGAI